MKLFSELTNYEMDHMTSQELKACAKSEKDASEKVRLAKRERMMTLRRSQEGFIDMSGVSVEDAMNMMNNQMTLKN